MKCYLLLHAVCKRNSTISLKTYGICCLQDNHLCCTCVRVIQLCKGALGKIKNTSRNYGRVRPSLSKLFCSQEDLNTLSAKCPPYNLPMCIYICMYIYIHIYIYICIYITHVQYLQEHTEKVCCIEALRIFISLYMHSKRIERAGQKLSKML